MQNVWDPVVRIGHWLLVSSVAAAWLTRGPGDWHVRIGYVALAVVAVRFVWGWIGPTRARFRDFVRSSGTTLVYAREMLAGKERRYLGHNPLGAWMIVALLLDITLVGVTGWMFTTDRYWGVEWVERLHELLADALLVLIALHVSGVLYASWRHRENLVVAMIHGRKREVE